MISPGVTAEARLHAAGNLQTELLDCYPFLNDAKWLLDSDWHQSRLHDYDGCQGRGDGVQYGTSSSPQLAWRSAPAPDLHRLMAHLDLTSTPAQMSSIVHALHQG